MLTIWFGFDSRQKLKVFFTTPRRRVFFCFAFWFFGFFF